MEASGVALVTGAGRGIGRAVAVELARRGFDVVATMRDPSHGAGLADEAGAGSRLTVERLDVNDESTMQMPPGLRVLVNNAGVESDNLPLEVMPADAWRAIFETNVFGLVAVTRHAIPALRDAGGGVICNVTSSSVLAPVPFLGAYRSSKAAVSAIGESLMAEVAAWGIRVLEILRQFGRERLVGDSEMLLRRRHLAWIADLAAIAGAHDDREVGAFTRLRAERANL